VNDVAMKTSIHTIKELINLLKQLQLKEKTITEEQLNKAISRLMQAIRKT